MKFLFSFLLPVTFTSYLLNEMSAFIKGTPESNFAPFDM